MAEPRVKRIKSSLPHCKSHECVGGSQTRQSFPSVVEESLCGVSNLLLEVSYRMRALASVFERSDRALPRVALFFHHESVMEQKRAEAMLQYLSQRGGTFCSKNIQRPGNGIEQGCSVLQALEITLNQWKEEKAVMAELSQLALDCGDPHTASIIKSRFLLPLISKVKLVGDLLTEARRAGCTIDSAGGFGEFLFNQLEEKLQGCG